MLNTKNDTIKDSYIRIRVTEKEKEFIKKLAEDRQISMTDFIKETINESIARKDRQVSCSNLFHKKLNELYSELETDLKSSKDPTDRDCLAISNKLLGYASGLLHADAISYSEYEEIIQKAEKLRFQYIKGDDKSDRKEEF